MERNTIVDRINKIEAAVKKTAPDCCKPCPNLSVGRDGDETLVPCCELTADGTDRDTRWVGMTEVVSASHDWLRDVISNMPNVHSASTDPDMNKAFTTLRDNIELAPDTCPIIGHIVTELAGTRDNRVIDLTPPTPLRPSQSLGEH